MTNFKKVREEDRVTQAQLAALKHAKIGSVSGHVHGITITSLQRRGLLDGTAITEKGLAVLASGRIARRRE
jgi:hypothetical protein